MSDQPEPGTPTAEFIPADTTQVLELAAAAVDRWATVLDRLARQ